MKFERKFYTQDEAAEKLGMSSGDIYCLVKTEQLPVCFDARGEVFGVTIRHPDGSIEYLPKELAVPVNGVLKSLKRPDDQNIMQVSIVQIIQVGDRQFRHVSGTELRPDGRPIPKLVADNSPIPTTNDPGKFVEPGFVVEGWVDFVDVPASDWRFHIDDLRQFSKPESDNPPAIDESPDSTKPPDNVATPNKALSKHAHQESEILRVIRELEYTPTALPKDKPGKDGIKAIVRDKLSHHKWTTLIFNKAWERLSGAKEIVKLK